MSNPYGFVPSFDKNKKNAQVTTQVLPAVSQPELPSNSYLMSPSRGLIKPMHKGVAYLKLIHAFGSRVAALDDGACTPWINQAVYIRGRELPFDDFLTMLKNTCQGNSAKDAVPGESPDVLAAADLVVTNANPGIGAVVTIELPEGRGQGGAPLLTVRFVINGANVDTNVRLAPSGTQEQGVYRRQFIIMAAVDNAGEASIALANSCVVTLPQADVWNVFQDVAAVPTAGGTVLTVENFSLRDFDR